jgi:glycosyltransferase involved in cell wall biosynthesis
LCNRILYSGFEFSHVDPASGYHHVVPDISRDYVNGDNLPCSRRSTRFQKHINYFLIDLLTIIRSFKYKGVFIIYPEHTVYISPLVLKIFGKKVICAMHHSTSFWDQPTFLRRLKKFNLQFAYRLVALTEHQRIALSSIVPTPIACIPHGIWPADDTCQILGSKERYEIVVVGSNYRDFDQLKSIVELFHNEMPNVLFSIIGATSDQAKGFISMQNVVLHPYLDSSTYFERLRHADAMVLPLTFATANNALLEGLSIGLPVFCSNVAGVREYLPDDQLVFDDEHDLLSQVRSFLEKSELERIKYSMFLKKNVERRFHWLQIQNQIRLAFEFQNPESS